MTTIDSNGIIRYEDSDGAPTPPVLNLGMQSVSDALGPYVDRIRWAVDGSASSLSFYSEPSAGGARLRLNSNGMVRTTRKGDSTQRALPFATQNREFPVTFGSRTSHTIAFNFSPNLFTAPPNVFTNIASGAGTARGWISRAVQITSTGFTLYLYSASGTSDAWSNIPVQWTAIQAEAA